MILRTWAALVVTWLCLVATFAPDLSIPRLPYSPPHALFEPYRGPETLERLREADAGMLAALALSEDPWAPEAVMWVALNRSIETGRPLLDVVAERRQFHGFEGLDPRRKIPTFELKRATRLARRVLAWEVPDPTGGATHFHAVGTWRPPWAPPPIECAILGRSEFYREDG